MDRPVRRAIWRLSGWTDGVSVTVATALGLASKSFSAKDVDLTYEFLNKASIALLEKAPTLLLALLGIAVAAKLLRYWLTNPFAMQQIEAIIEHLRKEAFVPAHTQRQGVHLHRVTLFQFKKYQWLVRPFRKPWWPWGEGQKPCAGWLVPFYRSGHTTQSSSTVFLAPGNGEAEGVVGQAWSAMTPFPLNDLPLITPRSTPGERRIYADKSFVSEDFINNRLDEKKPCPRSMLGFPVFKGEEPWGVVLIDSIHPRGVKDESDLPIQLVQHLMGKLVQQL